MPHTLAEIAKALNRPAVVISGLQARFELPGPDADGYSDAYLAFLRSVVYLRTLGITEDRLLRLWHPKRPGLASCTSHWFLCSLLFSCLATA